MNPAIVNTELASLCFQIPPREVYADMSPSEQIVIRERFGRLAWSMCGLLSAAMVNPELLPLLEQIVQAGGGMLLEENREQQGREDG